MNFKSILAVTDCSLEGDLALERAAQLAAVHGATLKLLVVPLMHSPSKVVHGRRAHATWDAYLRCGLRVQAANTSQLTVKEIAAHANDADLVVMPGRKERSWEAFFTGQPAERLARLCRSPILVTKGSPLKPFKRVLVAVDFAPPSQQIALLASDLAGNALLELFHAVDVIGEARLRQSDVPTHVIDGYRQASLRRAQQRMAVFRRTLNGKASTVHSAVGRGDPARQAIARQALVGADLLVVGTRRSSAFKDLLLGSTARQMLNLATCDVLLVPHDLRRPLTRPLAKLRLLECLSPGPMSAGAIRD